MGRTYPNEINRILYMPGGDVGKFARSLALDIAAEAARQATAILGIDPGDRARTGELARSYQVQVVPGTNKFLIRNPKKYAAAIEKGARPHTIKARRVDYLQFRARDGSWRRVKLVKHPGNRAYNLLRDASRTVVTRRLGSVTTR